MSKWLIRPPQATPSPLRWPLPAPRAPLIRVRCASAAPPAHWPAPNLARNHLFPLASMSSNCSPGAHSDADPLAPQINDPGRCRLDESIEMLAARRVVIG